MKTLWLGATLAAIAIVCGRPAAAQVRIVSVTGGRVEGVLADGITSFKGIPFAAPPVGNLRWRPPQPVRPWRGIRRADHFAPGCMQATNAVSVIGGSPAMSEDCLDLNVWTPAKSSHERLPVMVWIYGGSFIFGTTSQPAYDGTQLAKKGVVLVSLAYRLGVFGFLADSELSAESPHHVSGNYGLLDMIAGLQWVKRNIAKFGGDPSRVTVFGESAGGTAVSILGASPLGKGLFQRAIAESGSHFSLSAGSAPAGSALIRAEASGRRFLTKLGARNIKAARALDARVLQNALGPAPNDAPRFGPVSDGYVLPEDEYRLYQTGRFNDTPVLIGSNSDEGSLFVKTGTTPSQFESQIRALFGPYADAILAAYPHATDSESSRAALDLFRDTEMVWGAWTWAKLQSENGQGKAYLYYFDVPTPQDPHGSPHGAEIGYVFDNLGTLIHSGAKMTLPAAATDPALAAMISSYWVNFARTGNPNGPGLPVWPAFNASSQRAMYLDAHPHAGPVPNLRKLEAFDAYFHWRREEAKKKRAN